MHESFFKMKDFYKKCNKPLQTEKSCHTFAHNQSNQINQLSNCDLFFSGFVGQGLFLPTLFFGCFLKCEISVFGMMLSVLVRVSWRMLFFSSWKCFGILGSRTWIFIFFVVSFLYIFVIKNINKSNKSSFSWMKHTWRTETQEDCSILGYFLCFTSAVAIWFPFGL